MRQLRVLVGCEMSGRVRHEFAKRGWDAWSCDILPDETEEWGGEGSHRVPTYTRERTPPPHRNRYYKRREQGKGIERHYQGDVFDLYDWDHPVNADRKKLRDDWWAGGWWNSAPDPREPPLWDFAMMFPPCTHLTYAGNRWRAQKRADGREAEAAKFFMQCYYAPSPLCAVENPRGVMSTAARPEENIPGFRRPDQEVHPYYFGDPFRKTTCFWTRANVTETGALPQLVRTDECQPESTGVSGDLKGYRFGAVVTQGSKYQERFGSGANHWEDHKGRKNRSKVRSLTFPGIARAIAGQWGGYAEGYYLDT